MTDLAVTLNLSDRARARLADQAAASGQDVADYASRLVERAVDAPTLDEILAPYRKQVAESGMSDEELDDFFRGQIEAYRSERRLAREAGASPS